MMAEMGMVVSLGDPLKETQQYRVLEASVAMMTSVMVGFGLGFGNDAFERYGGFRKEG